MMNQPTQPPRPWRSETAAHWALTPAHARPAQAEADRRKSEQIAHAARLQATQDTAAAAGYLRRCGWSVLSALTLLAR